MTELEFIFQTALFCIGLHVCVMRDGMILTWALPYLSRLPYFIQKPLYSCVPCMGGIYTLLHWFVAGGGLEWVLVWIIGAVVGLGSLYDIAMRGVEAIENLETFEE